MATETIYTDEQWSEAMNAAEQCRRPAMGVVFRALTDDEQSERNALLLALRDDLDIPMIGATAEQREQAAKAEAAIAEWDRAHSHHIDPMVRWASRTND